MGNYFIKDLENITGIKAHTIRVWEQRYQLITPKRTQTNIRYYDDEDVKLLLNIALLNKKGLKISKIATLSRPQICSEVLDSCQRSQVHDDLINALLLATYNLNESEFNRIFSEFVFREGFENTMLKLGFPLLQRIGELWVSDALLPAQEHFASNILRTKLQIAVESQQHKKENAKKFILFLPPGEMHEISLLFARYIITSMGHEVLYLGQNTPVDNFSEVLELFPADYLVSIFTHFQSELDPVSFINNIHQQFPNLKVLVSGFRLLNNRLYIEHALHHPGLTRILEAPEDLKNYLESI